MNIPNTGSFDFSFTSGGAAVIYNGQTITNLFIENNYGTYSVGADVGESCEKDTLVNIAAFITANKLVLPDGDPKGFSGMLTFILGA